MTRVVIVGAGKGGRALLEMFAGDSSVSILGVADLNPWAPGIEFARRLNVPVTTERRLIPGTDDRYRSSDGFSGRSAPADRPRGQRPRSPATSPRDPAGYSAPEGFHG